MFDGFNHDLIMMDRKYLGSHIFETMVFGTMLNEANYQK